MVGVDGFGEVNHLAENEVFFSDLYSHRLFSFCSLNFYVHAFRLVIIIIRCDVVDLGGPYALSLASDVALDPFI
ncbi:MAG: hypothetical protein ACKPA7_00440 [Sphaerospermopsis kisseleviana]